MFRRFQILVRNFGEWKKIDENWNDFWITEIENPKKPPYFGKLFQIKTGQAKFVYHDHHSVKSKTLPWPSRSSPLASKLDCRIKCLQLNESYFFGNQRTPGSAGSSRRPVQMPHSAASIERVVDTPSSTGGWTSTLWSQVKCGVGWGGWKVGKVVEGWWGGGHSAIGQQANVHEFSDW